MAGYRLKPFAFAMAAAVLLAAQGCFLFGETYPAQPTDRLRPTIAGVVTIVTTVGDHNVYTLADGSTYDEPTNQKGFQELSSVTPGGLYLRSDQFQYGLDPLGDLPGCWQAMAGGNSDAIVWDLGDSILFDDGLNLLKAPDYYADPEPKLVGGQLAWTRPMGDITVPWMSFCANDQGKIEWAKADITKARP
jgi:hypothetical protein